VKSPRVCKTDDGPSTSLTFSLVQRCIDETTLVRIRMRVPDEFLMETDYVKQLTLDVIKFGITYSVNSRNGPLLATVTMDTWRSVSTAPVAEAQIVEDIMRYDFSKIAVLNSYEYAMLRCLRILGVEFDNTSYDSYPGRHRHYTNHAASGCTRCGHATHAVRAGYRTTSSPSTLVHNIENDTTSIHSDLSFKCSD
jgi:hypothetical protein